jgi:beta-N-acetylhexosaminidase
MTASLRQAAGSLLIAGLSGTELTNLERAWLKLVRPAGIILFRRNIENAKLTRELLQEATGLCTAHSFRCVDVEGGTGAYPVRTGGDACGHECKEDEPYS